MKLWWPTNRKLDTPKEKVKKIDVECESGITIALEEDRHRHKILTATWLLSQFPNAMLVDKATGENIRQGSLLKEGSTILRFEKRRLNPSEIAVTRDSKAKLMYERIRQYKQAIAKHRKKLEVRRARREVEALRKRQQPLTTIPE